MARTKLKSNQLKFSGAQVNGNGLTVSSGVYAQVLFGTIVYDTDSYVSAGVFVTPFDGYYDLNLVFHFGSFGAGQRIIVVADLPSPYGSTYEIDDFTLNGADASSSHTLHGIYMVKGSTVMPRIFLVTNSANLDVTSKYTLSFRGV